MRVVLLLKCRAMKNMSGWIKSVEIPTDQYITHVPRWYLTENLSSTWWDSCTEEQSGSSSNILSCIFSGLRNLFHLCFIFLLVQLKVILDLTDFIQQRRPMRLSDIECPFVFRINLHDTKAFCHFVSLAIIRKTVFIIFFHQASIQVGVNILSHGAPGQATHVQGFGCCA